MVTYPREQVILIFIAFRIQNHVRFTLRSPSDAKFAVLIASAPTGLEAVSQMSVWMAGLKVKVLTRDIQNTEQLLFPLHLDFRV
jgi:hypothetical protein